jgi:hypothetical protein
MFNIYDVQKLKIYALQNSLLRNASNGIFKKFFNKKRSNSGPEENRRGGGGRVAWIQEECRDAHCFSKPKIRQSSRCCEGHSRGRVGAGWKDGPIPTVAFCGGSK